jgi:heavy metal-binding protein
VRLTAAFVAAVLLALVRAPQPAAMQAQAAAGHTVFWCPMHPDVRGREGDKCPLCGMALVRAAAADASAYRLDLETIPRVLRPEQKARARFFVRDPRTNATVRRFDLVHERVFHLFVISQDLEYFTHVHPTLHGDGSLDVGVELPRPGVYQLIADFLPAAGSPQLLQKSIVTAGYAGPLATVPVRSKRIERASRNLT